MRLVFFQTLTICFAALPALGGTVVTDVLLEAVAHIESSGGRHTVGDDGLAIGWWQMHEPAWQDTTAFRARQGLLTWDYDQAHNPKIARLYARDYLTILESQIRTSLRQEPTVEMVYAAYNLGFGRFQSFGFNLAKTPASTQKSCARLQSLIVALKSPQHFGRE